MSDLVLSIQSDFKTFSSEISRNPEKTIVETCFISNFFTGDCVRIQYDGTGKITVNTYGRTESYDCERFILTGDDTVDGPTKEILYFYYFGGTGFYSGTNYGLIIQDRDDSVLYWRERGQAPRTEWLINCLAETFEDENGEFVFVGEPVTI